MSALGSPAAVMSDRVEVAAGLFFMKGSGEFVQLACFNRAPYPVHQFLIVVQIV